MQEKVLVYVKSHIKGIVTTILVLVAIFIGYSWGNSDFTSNLEREITNIKENLENQNSSNIPNSTTGNVKNNDSTVRSGTQINSNNEKSVIINSDKIRPIPKDTKPEDRPLYYFY